MLDERLRLAEQQIIVLQRDLQALQKILYGALEAVNEDQVAMRKLLLSLEQDVMEAFSMVEANNQSPANHMKDERTE